MRRALLLCLLLAACGTPQEQCINAETRDLRVLDGLIAETRGNIARGYAIESYTTQEMRWVQCERPRPAAEGRPARPGRMCHEFFPVERTRPKAINLTEERAKLASMEQRRAQLAREVAPRIATCRALHPE